MPRSAAFSGNGRRFRVLEVVPFEGEDESSFVELLQVEATQRTRYEAGRRMAGLRA